MMPTLVTSIDIYGYLSKQLRLQRGMKQANPNVDTGDPYEMTFEELARFITWNVTALMAELGEMLNEVGWKPWASSRHINMPAAMDEMVDAWHFFLNILLAQAAWHKVDLSTMALAFEAQYVKKNAKNLQRQIEGYDGVSGKCAHCHRELDSIHPDHLRVMLMGPKFNPTHTVKLCSEKCAAAFDPHKEEDMSMHDPDQVQKIRQEIDEKSSAQPPSKTYEQMQQELIDRHRAAQQATGLDDFSPPEQAASVNPHAARMVADAEVTGEPLFCFRARDFFSVQVISFYSDLVAKYGPSDAEFHRNIVDALNEFKEWQKNNVEKVRYPD